MLDASVLESSYVLQFKPNLGSTSYLTLERFVARVRPEVRGQLLFREEPFRAGVTLVVAKLKR